MSSDKRTRVPKMEGRMAHWYARNRNTPSQMADYRRQATALAADLPAGAAILEVAPGPGYLAVELARLGRFTVAGWDLSHTFVGLAREYAQAQGVDVDFRQGDAVRIGHPDDTFDLIVCQAAFKNFTHPVQALDEMHRVLKPGGAVIIQDMSHEATGAELTAEVRRMSLTSVNAVFTRVVFTFLRARALPVARFRQYAQASRFGGCQTGNAGALLEVRLAK